MCPSREAWGVVMFATLRIGYRPTGCMYAYVHIYIYIEYKCVAQAWLKVLAQASRPPAWALHENELDAFETKAGVLCRHFVITMTISWGRRYQVCRNSSCGNWIWDDKVCEGFVCRRCGQSWSRPAQEFSTKKSPSPRRSGPCQKPLTPPPGLGGTKGGRQQHVHKATTDLLTASRASLDPKLQHQLEQLGIKPPNPTPEPDLTDVLKENLSQLPTVVKDLVEKITRPPPETERDMAQKLKAQVSTLRDLSHRKQVLQQKLDQAKKTYGDMLEEMKGIQTKLEAEQGALNTTSSAYMALANTSKPVEGLQPEAMDDTVPEAVAGFITTLGVNLTDDQKAQLNTMLKRPQSDLSEEETQRRRTAAMEVQTCGEPNLLGLEPTCHWISLFGVC